MPIDYSKYPLNWSAEIVPRILKRAGNKCEFCGLENKIQVWSGKIYTRQHGIYSYRTIWVSDPGDWKRIKPLLVEKSIKTIIVVLTVAHLDHDESNPDVKDDRLAALCQYCHLNYDAKEKYRRACKKSSENDLRIC